jgi:hypothetical protein
MRNFVDNLQQYYDESDSFTKELIDWCCVSNSSCPLYIFKNIHKKEKYNKNGLRSNYYGNHIVNFDKSTLLPISNNDIKKLKEYIATLDGTLLVDLFSDILRNRNIFYV